MSPAAPASAGLTAPRPDRRVLAPRSSHPAVSPGPGRSSCRALLSPSHAHRRGRAVSGPGHLPRLVPPAPAALQDRRRVRRPARAPAARRLQEARRHREAPDRRPGVAPARPPAAPRAVSENTDSPTLNITRLQRPPARAADFSRSRPDTRCRIPHPPGNRAHGSRCENPLPPGAWGHEGVWAWTPPNLPSLVAPPPTHPYARCQMPNARSTAHPGPLRPLHRRRHRPTRFRIAALSTLRRALSPTRSPRVAKGGTPARGAVIGLLFASTA